MSCFPKGCHAVHIPTAFPSRPRPWELPAFPSARWVPVFHAMLNFFQSHPLTQRSCQHFRKRERSLASPQQFRDESFKGAARKCDNKLWFLKTLCVVKVNPRLIGSHPDSPMSAKGRNHLLFLGGLMALRSWSQECPVRSNR